MSYLILLRHGETAGQSSVRLFGSTDIPLSDFGVVQMQLAGGALKDVRFSTVIASPLRRSLDSAGIVLDGRPQAVTVVDDFREINFGEWEGLTKQEIFERDPDRYREWQESGRFIGFPGGDTRDGFFGRVRKAATEVFGRTELPALAVLHKGVIRGILSALLDVTAEELSPHPIELGSIHRLEKTPGGWSLTVRNETAHLGEYRKEGS